MDFKYCKLEIFIPEENFPELQKALQSVDAGHIGNYDSCVSCLRLTSYWRPLEGTAPYIGKAGEISCEPEIKAEVPVFKEKVDELTMKLEEAGYPVDSGPRTTGDGYYESCVVAIEENQIEITV